MVSINSKAVKYFAKIEYDNNHELQIPLLGYLDFDNDYSYAPNDNFSLIVPSYCIQIYNQVILTATLDYSPMPTTSLIFLVNSTDLVREHSGIYNLLRLCIFELWCLNFTVKNNSFIQYIDIDSVTKLRENLKWIANWANHYRKYRFLVEYLRSLDVAVGYIYGQLNLSLSSDDLSKAVGNYYDNLR